MCVTHPANSIPFSGGPRPHVLLCVCEGHGSQSPPLAGPTTRALDGLTLCVREGHVFALVRFGSYHTPHPMCNSGWARPIRRRSAGTRGVQRALTSTIVLLRLHRRLAAGTCLRGTAARGRATAPPGPKAGAAVPRLPARDHTEGRAERILARSHVWRTRILARRPRVAKLLPEREATVRLGGAGLRTARPPLHLSRLCLACQARSLRVGPRQGGALHLDLYRYRFRYVNLCEYVTRDHLIAGGLL